MPQWPKNSPKQAQAANKLGFFFFFTEKWELYKKQPKYRYQSQLFDKDSKQLEVLVQSAAWTI